MLKLIGVLFVVGGASGTGIVMALGVRRSLALARQLRTALEQMKNEIECLKTPLPALMELLASQYAGPLSDVFRHMALQLRLRQEASVYAIMRKSLAAVPALPASLRRILLELGPGLGQYDVQAQLRAIELAAGQAQALAEELQAGQKNRARSYCTLGVCAGLAIAILVL